MVSEVVPQVEDVIGRPLSPYAITMPNVSDKIGTKPIFNFCNFEFNKLEIEK